MKILGIEKRQSVNSRHEKVFQQKPSSNLLKNLHFELILELKIASEQRGQPIHKKEICNLRATGTSTLAPIQVTWHFEVEFFLLARDNISQNLATTFQCSHSTFFTKFVYMIFPSRGDLLLSNNAHNTSSLRFLSEWNFPKLCKTFRKASNLM